MRANRQAAGPFFGPADTGSGPPPSLGLGAAQADAAGPSGPQPLPTREAPGPADTEGLPHACQADTEGVRPLAGSIARPPRPSVPGTPAQQQLPPRSSSSKQQRRQQGQRRQGQRWRQRRRQSGRSGGRSGGTAAYPVHPRLLHRLRPADQRSRHLRAPRERLDRVPAAPAWPARTEPAHSSVPCRSSSPPTPPARPARGSGRRADAQPHGGTGDGAGVMVCRALGEGA